MSSIIPNIECVFVNYSFDLYIYKSKNDLRSMRFRFPNKTVTKKGDSSNEMILKKSLNYEYLKKDRVKTKEDLIYLNFLSNKKCLNLV